MPAPFDKLAKIVAAVPVTLYPLAELIAVANAAERLSDCICEFSDSKECVSFCSEHYEALDATLFNLKVAQAELLP